jgi:23S rRNA (cytidine1920-2'-O)/16S rRNA (cytidine1409-2'-O)-methyltransferase
VRDSSSKTVKRVRLDSLLVTRNLAETRNQAQALIMAGNVLVEGETERRPARLLNTDTSVGLAEAIPYVSRGGFKMAHAIDTFRIDVRDKVAIDVGASTGGFTDCLLQRGASTVYAIDVGYGQLHYRLRKDPRVVVMERQNARDIFDLPERADLAVMDVSFISLTKVIPSVLTHLKPDSKLVALLKPQFEGEREEVGKGGVIRDPMVHARIIGRFVKWVVNQSLILKGLTSSPILGDAGNREFLLLLSMN